MLEGLAQIQNSLAGRICTKVHGETRKVGALDVDSVAFHVYLSMLLA